MVKFSIILPAYNNPKELGLLLESIEKNCPAISNHELIVVDDASDTHPIEPVCKRFEFVKYLRCEKNGGVAKARNEGARVSKNDILVFIDTDLIVQTDFVSVLSEKFKDPAILAVSGTSSDIPANPSPFREYWGLYKAFNMPKGAHTSLFCGQQGAIRKDIFFKAGGWDANIRGVSKEEYEFTGRLENLGVKINYEEKFELKPHYKGFFKLVPENCRRAKKWCIIFLYRKKFDDYTSTFSGGMSYILGAFVIVAGLASIIFPKLFIIFVSGLLGYVILTFNFWVFISKRKGIKFTLLSIFFHLVSSVFISWGALHGLSYCFLSEASRREAINN